MLKYHCNVVPTYKLGRIGAGYFVLTKGDNAAPRNAKPYRQDNSAF